MDLETIRYPIGRFAYPKEVSSESLKLYKEQIEQLPLMIQNAVSGLNQDQLSTRYRAAGWTVSQVVHHLCDSHMNAFVRVKLALTEDEPTIKPYIEGAWATLADVSNVDILSSLIILEGLHKRWSVLNHSLTSRQWSKKLIHPEANHKIRVDQIIALYAWHGRHHVGHIQSLRSRMAW